MGVLLQKSALSVSLFICCLSMSLICLRFLFIFHFHRYTETKPACQPNIRARCNTAREKRVRSLFQREKRVRSLFQREKRVRSLLLGPRGTCTSTFLDTPR